MSLADTEKNSRLDLRAVVTKRQRQMEPSPSSATQLNASERTANQRFRGMSVARRFAVHRRLCALLTLMAALLRGQAAGLPAVEFPFEFREGLLWVEVTVPQEERPLHFLLDSGAGASVMHLDTAKRLQPKLGRKVAVQGVGAALTGYWLECPSARAGEVPLPTQFLALDLSRFGQACERPVDGLIGADFFHHRVVQIDFVASRIRLLPTTQGPGAGQTLPMEVRSCGLRVPVRVNGQARQWVRLDTGCASALQWVTASLRPEHCTRRVAIGLAEVSIPQTVTTVGLGELEFQQVPTGLHREAIFPGEAGLLGNGLLARFRTVTIDARNGRLHLGTPAEAK